MRDWKQFNLNHYTNGCLQHEMGTNGKASALFGRRIVWKVPKMNHLETAFQNGGFSLNANVASRLMTELVVLNKNS